VSVLGLLATVNKCKQDRFLYMNYRVMPEGINGDDVTLRTIIWKANREGSLWIAEKQ
jgi:hypothetical protein